MSRLQPIDPVTAEGPAHRQLERARAAFGALPNLVRTMAQAPAVLDGYLSLNQALAGGQLDPALRERIALLTAEANQCGYCLSAHSLLGKRAGLAEAEIAAARRGTAADPATAAALSFAAAVIRERGHVSAAALAEVRAAGHDDGAITEIVGQVALNLFTNYFNSVAGTEIDFPVVRPLAA